MNVVFLSFFVFSLERRRRRRNRAENETLDKGRWMRPVNRGIKKTTTRPAYEKNRKNRKEIKKATEKIVGRRRRDRTAAARQRIIDTHQMQYADRWLRPRRRFLRYDRQIATVAKRRTCPVVYSTFIEYSSRVVAWNEGGNDRISVRISISLSNQTARSNIKIDVEMYRTC